VIRAMVVAALVLAFVPRLAPRGSAVGILAGLAAMGLCLVIPVAVWGREGWHAKIPVYGPAGGSVVILFVSFWSMSAALA